MIARRLVTYACAAALVLAPAIAFAHGETATTDPEPGARLKRAPSAVSVSLTEPPAEGARFSVTDGCGDTVSQGEQIDGSVLSTAISDGRPGTWRASYKVISSVDGHVTQDKWRFKVAGKKDCSPGKREKPKKPKKKDRQDPDNDGGGTGPHAGGPDPDGGSSFPVLPVALGTAGLVGVALVIRARSAT